MSEEQLKAFLEKVKSDTELQNKLNASASLEAAMEIAKVAGFLITADDIQSMQSVSDEELEGAAGGTLIGCQQSGQFRWWLWLSAPWNAGVYCWIF